jgi:glyoxylase-like metal-dependent hydrolase (beta-lactamase superfamily II)
VDSAVCIEACARESLATPPRHRRFARPLRLAVTLAWLVVSLMSPPASAAPVAVADGVFVLRDTFDPGRQPDGNSVIFVGPGGLVVVDTGRHREHAQALLDFAAARRAPIVAVVNTHWHLDHLAGNALLRDHASGLTVYASTALAPALGGWLAASRRDMQDMLDSGRADPATEAMARLDIAIIDSGPRLLPDVVLDAPRSIAPAGQRLQIGYESKAVTAGDLWVYDPAAKVLASGDLVTLPVPFLDTACAPGWRASLAQLEAVPFERLVPGHGAPMSRADFAVWRGAFEALLSCAAGDAAASSCAAGWVAALGPLLPQTEHARARGMIGYYLEQHLRAEPAQRDRFCR